jgi:hypothetical protein
VARGVRLMRDPEQRRSLREVERGERKRGRRPRVGLDHEVRFVVDQFPLAAESRERHRGRRVT